LLEGLAPAVKRAKTMQGDTVENAVRANVQLTVASLLHSKPVLEHMVRSGKLKIIGARYDLDSGKVELVK
jgi:carbonic anhydrase